MRDGNRESAKELLSTIRINVSISISTVLVASGLWARHELPIPWLCFIVSTSALCISIIVAIYTFYLAIVKFHNEDEGIIYSQDIWVCSVVNLLFFIVGQAMLIFSLIF